MKLGRNDVCHCGSGKKYKHCHELSKKKQNNQYIIVGIIAIIVIAVVSIDSGGSNSNQNAPVSSPLINQRNSGTALKPSGLAPPGKVWSQEHGHWHDAPVSKSLTPKILGKNEVNKITVPKQDKNNPPEGKVWNEEHGHFHDKE